MGCNYLSLPLIPHFFVLALLGIAAIGSHINATHLDFRHIYIYSHIYDYIHLCLSETKLAWFKAWFPEGKLNAVSLHKQSSYWLIHTSKQSSAIRMMDWITCQPFTCWTFLGLILSIPAWIRKHINYIIWGVITYPFPHFKGCTVEVWKWTNNFMPHITWHIIYLSMMGLKLIHVSKRGPRKHGNVIVFSIIFNTRVVQVVEILSWWKIRIRLSYIITTMAADGLAA